MFGLAVPDVRVLHCLYDRGSLPDKVSYWSVVALLGHPLSIDDPY
jgi:hypothetical protein